MVNPAVSPDVEDDIFNKEVEQVKTWWSDSRWKHTKRPFTAEQIVSKRGYLKVDYPSNTQAKKLWNILENRFQVRPRSKTAGYSFSSSVQDVHGDVLTVSLLLVLSLEQGC